MTFVLETLFLALSGLSLAWLLLIHALTWCYFRWGAGCPGDGAAPPVSIIRPIFRITDAVLPELRSFCQQDYPGEHEVLFCAEPSDTASLPVVNRVIAQFPHRDARLLLSDETHPQIVGKLRNTVAGLAHARHDIVIFADDDVTAPPSYLRDTLPCMADRRIGLAFSAPAYQGCETWAAALMAIYTNSLVLRVGTACALGISDLACAQTMITRKSVLERIGGLEQFGRHINDDLPLSRTIVRSGYHVRLLRPPAQVVHRRDTLTRCWWNLHRWLVAIRHYYPVRSAMMNVLDLGLWWGILYCVVTALRTGSLGLGASVLGVLALAFVVSTAVVNLTFGRDRNLWQFLWVALVLELLRLPLIVHSVLTNEVVWRGRRFRIQRDCTTTLVKDGRSADPADLGAERRAAGGHGTP